MRVNGLTGGKRVSRRKIGELIFYICMVALPMLQVCVFFIAVNINSVFLAFKEFTVDGTFRYVGLANFKEFFEMAFGSQSTAIRMMFKNSGLLYLTGLLVGIPLNLLFSFLIYKKVPGSSFFNVILFLPQILSSIVMSIMYRYFVEKAIPSVASMFGINSIPSFFVDIPTAFPTVIFYNVWAGFGAQIIVYVSTMSRIPDELVEEGRLEGMTLWQEFVNLTFPMIYSTMTTYLIVSTAGFFTNQASLYNFFGTSAPSYVQTFGYYLFVTVLKSSSYDAYPLAASMGLVFTFVSIPVVLLLKRAVERFDPEVEL